MGKYDPAYFHLIWWHTVLKGLRRCIRVSLWFGNNAQKSICPSVIFNQLGVLDRCRTGKVDVKPKSAGAIAM